MFGEVSPVGVRIRLRLGDRQPVDRTNRSIAPIREWGGKPSQDVAPVLPGYAIELARVSAEVPQRVILRVRDDAGTVSKRCQNVVL